MLSNKSCVFDTAEWFRSICASSMVDHMVLLSPLQCCCSAYRNVHHFGILEWITLAHCTSRKLGKDLDSIVHMLCESGPSFGVSARHCQLKPFFRDPIMSMNLIPRSLQVSSYMQ